MQLPRLVGADGHRLALKGCPGQIAELGLRGDLAWASYQGEPVAVGTYKAGELHPTRVFRL